MSERPDIHERVLNSNSPAELMAIYKDWATRYDHDLAQDWGYPAPALAVQHLMRVLRSRDAQVLDAGCGTGLVGQLMHDQGLRQLHGLDFSPEMLAQAQGKGVYQSLTQADLNQPLALADDRFDAVISVGTFTSAHVQPQALNELARIVRPGGWLVFTVRDSHWDETHFDQIVLALASGGRARIHEWRSEPYIEQEQSTCKLLVLERL